MSDETSNLKRGCARLLADELSRRGITRDELARRASEKPETIARWLADPAALTFEQLCALAHLAGCELRLTIGEVRP